jgi:signal transduction histidine kinase
MLFWYVLALAVAIGAAVLVDRQLLVARIDARIDDDLVQEAEELRRLARGRDPRTGRPFGARVDRVFQVFLQRNIPTQTETYFTFVDGEPFARSFREPPYRLDRDPGLVRRWADLTRTDRGRVPTPVGTVEYLAVPLRARGETRGVFVAAIFRELELAEIAPAIWGAAWVGLATLLVGSRLASTFNDMLDRLEEAFRTQRQFVDDAGHELRTPITVIRGHLELLDEDPEERRKTVMLVTDELDRMSRIVNDLLLLAKAEQPDFLDLATVELEALTEELHAKSRTLAPRDWRLEEVARGLVVADRQRLTQSLMQLAQNAADHTKPGAEIAVGSAIADGRARLWVRDTGPGIPPDDTERIFQRFARGRGGRRGSQGAGLGLAIVRAIAEAHHGTVDVQSRPGFGATFTVDIPVDQPEPQQEARA